MKKQFLALAVIGVLFMGTQLSAATCLQQGVYNLIKDDVGHERACCIAQCLPVQVGPEVPGQDQCQSLGQCIGVNCAREAEPMDIEPVVPVPEPMEIEPLVGTVPMEIG